MKNISNIAWYLIVIGAINWGLVAVLNVDLVAAIFGSIPMLAKVVYVLVGVSGIYALAEKFGLV